MVRLTFFSRIFACCAALVAGVSAPAHGQSTSIRPLNADSFRLGSGGGAICQVQSRGRDVVLSSMFDRAWLIVCRDAARPIGRLYALRGADNTLVSRLVARRQTEASCAPHDARTVEGLGSVAAASCRLNGAEVGYTVLSQRKGKLLYVAEGLTAYEGALVLGLRSIIDDKVAPGQIAVATSGSDDPAAFARLQAGSLDPDKALAEGYRRNNAGDYAEAAEFFDTLQQKLSGTASNADMRTEYIINQALQKSNLGDFAEADMLLAEAQRTPTTDRVQVRLRRNYAALHLLNQNRYDEALARVRQPVSALPSPPTLPDSAIEIGAQVAAEINAGISVSQRIGATEISSLTPDERARFLDAQALSIEGTVLRLQGNPASGRALLERALTDMMKIRNGRVTSIIRLRSQVTAEAALSQEAEGNFGAAEAGLRSSVELLELRYPETVALNGARARLAAFLARRGQPDAAITVYKQIVASAIANQTVSSAMGNLLAPYFGLLASGKGGASAPEDLLLASQTLVRPGVADTQAVLARELSEANSEGARLFRQSRSLARDIERTRIELATLLNQPNQTADIKAATEILRRDLASLEGDQATAQAKLSDFPQYRAISNKSVSMSELQGQLKAGEAYFKLLVAGSDVFALLADGGGALTWKVPGTANDLQERVTLLRDTIALEEDGQIKTYAYDVDAARQLYIDLAGPAADRLAAARHIVFEPDGAMLQLPLNLLISGQKGVDAYKARLAEGGDEFDFTGVEWLGRGRSVSTAVSVRSFRDARSVQPSRAARQYVGFGRNVPISEAPSFAAQRGGDGASLIDCRWPASVWNRPISEAELTDARAVIGENAADVIAGASFTDTGITSRTDLANYRIVHFATHGLVTAPRPECPARPALVTSFAGDGVSDGLLSFREIFDMKLDADLIILSACDTAGKASVAATREAGVTTGGGSALDGLVRAFIGAGSRSVIASHWPAPDDFNATRRLISGLFKSQSGTSVGDALGNAQLALMDDPETSHPYYWAGFAIIGDSARSLISAQ